ncbi:NHL repeat-containing protein [Actinoplanes sp. RD1]|uniref:hypothetical protein n=1 Tax=Actinoplanes sp. RD1 TaxID=3064538 RepID=UPI002741868A|nr:hypothetical protein [Actinoplanes sp. RD1]
MAFTNSVPGTHPIESTKTPPAPRIIAHFDRAAGQTAESVVVEPDGSADVGFIVSRQLAHVTNEGYVQILATMPLPADGGKSTPTGQASVTGVERTKDGTLYFLYSAGDSALTGLWRLHRGGKPVRIAAMPATSFLNGLTRDEHTGNFYITDSALGRIWKVGPLGGKATAWAVRPSLAPTTFFGANGVKVHDHAVWASNLDQGTIVRIPITRSGAAGPDKVEVTGLDSVDDFAFTGRGDQLLAALNIPSQLALINPGKPPVIVLDSGDGLQNTTAVAVHSGMVYVTSGALSTGGDANLLTAPVRMFPLNAVSRTAPRPA